MLRVHYCNKCLQELESYGEAVSLFYEQVCEHFIESEEPLAVCEIDCLALLTEFYTSLDSIIHFLEMKNYIVSTETDYNVIMIKPVGYVSNGFFNLCRNSWHHD